MLRNGVRCNRQSVDCAALHPCTDGRERTCSGRLTPPKEKSGRPLHALRSSVKVFQREELVSKTPVRKDRAGLPMSKKTACAPPGELPTAGQRHVHNRSPAGQRWTTRERQTE